MQKIIINADDVGVHPAADAAIAALAGDGVISSASVMALAHPDRDALAQLLDYGTDLGLHLDFTSGFAARSYGTNYSVKTLIRDAWRRKLDPVQTRHVIRQQLERFEELVGERPGFIDGHEHVHQFPVIREALFAVLAERYRNQSVWLRNTGTRRWRGTKAAVIALLGSAKLRKLARANGFRCNPDFAGVYGFDPSVDLGALWSNWLAGSRREGLLIMCHPAASIVPDDGIALARVHEFRFLASAQFKELLAKQAVAVSSWDDALSESAA